MKHSSGLTLVELLVVVAIVSILLGLSVSSIQYAREAARNQTCQSQLRQIGLAVAAYESQFRFMPAALAPTGSIHVTLLPYLEQNELYRDISLSGPSNYDPVLIGNKAISLPILLCPTDSAPYPEAGSGTQCGTNYAACIGIWTAYNGFDGAFRPLEKPWSTWTYGAGPLSLSEFTDGTAHTASFSELLRSDGSTHRLRVTWEGPISETLAEFSAGCISVTQNNVVSSTMSRGTPWTDGNVGQTLYNHAIPPNNPTCNHGDYILEAASTAASQHPSGVNVLYVDGHVAFTADSVDRDVWQSVGSRSSTPSIE